MGGQMGQMGMGQMGLGQMGGSQMGQMGGQMGGFGGLPGMGLPGGQQLNAGGQPGFGMPGQQFQGQASMGTPFQQSQAPEADERTLEDLACTVGPHREIWSVAKQIFRNVFQETLPWQPIPREQLSMTMESALQLIKSANAMTPQTAEECGLGKLTIQLFSFASIEEPQVLLQLFSGFEQLASPVLTMLLDMPWAALSQTGWPLLALLAQINQPKAQLGALNDERVDGLDSPIARQFQAQLMAALAARDGGAAQEAATAYLSTSPQSGSETALASLTALAAQALASPDPQERLQILDILQQALKQVVGSGPELDLALSTRWPLWGVLHVAMDAFGG